MMASAVAVSEVRTDSHSAVLTESSLTMSQRSPHGIRQSNPTNGRAKNVIATIARASTGIGNRSRSPRIGRS